ncbi:stage V sporulation protein B [Paenibacillus alvei]|uniref:stage V sporulation protein B n=1 Tax=Paenibacillus alvei TaxID=44250 RepID=UPI001FD2730D|nr:stage V sporulation protein B [Paenibacillus alvei]
MNDIGRQSCAEVRVRRGIPLLKSTLQKQTFIQGTLILLAAGIVNRILGFIPRIMLPRIIGAEGVGIYQLGYPFLIVIITLITGGIPLAVAKLIAEADAVGDQQRVKRILSLALKITIGASIVFSAALLILAPWITTHVLTDSRVYYTFLVMTPIIIVIAASSVFRGYFQGMQNMIPTATSQVVETIIRIFTVIAFAYMCLPYGLEWAAAGAMAGVVIGEIGGFAVLAWMYYTSRRRSTNSTSEPTDMVLKPAKNGHAPTAPPPNVLRRLLQITLPVTGGKLVGSLSYLLESITIARSLAAAGVITAIATAQYGALQGMIIPILTLPGALTYSLAVSLVPALSEALGRNDTITIQKRIHQAVRLALVSGAPFAVVMFVLAFPLCALLYNDATVAPMLKWMAPVAIFIYLQAPLQAALQALERPGTALVNTFIGAILKIGLILWLASNPQLGITGAVIAINVNIVVVTTLHAFSVVRHIGLKLPWMDFIKVGAAMVITAGCIQAVYIHLSSSTDEHILLRFILSCIVGIIVYILLLILMKLIDRSDIARFPIFRRFFPAKPDPK